MDTSKTNDIPVLDGCKQRYMVLCLLQAGPVNSVELRGLGVLNPAARLSEIRQRGYPVKTRLLASVVGPSGSVHRRVAEYRLSRMGSKLLVFPTQHHEAFMNDKYNPADKFTFTTLDFFEANCDRCRWLDQELQTHCLAYPKGDGIPEIIRDGTNPHTEPFPGDHGITFEVLE